MEEGRLPKSVWCYNLHAAPGGLKFLRYMHKSQNWHLTCFWFPHDGAQQHGALCDTNVMAVESDSLVHILVPLERGILVQK